MKIIAHIRSPLMEKFGIPRQSGLTELPAEIVFEPEYRVREAFRGLEGYSHIWLIWEFSEAAGREWSPTVRPPRLGGNKRMGVFATRSPFRPNPIGLSSVRLEKILWDVSEAPVLAVTGADLMDGTPIYDIKPYLAYTDSHPEAAGGFALQEKTGRLRVEFPRELLEKIPQELRQGLVEVLSQDPRPQYQNSPERVYIMSFGGVDVHFSVDGELLTVKSIAEKKSENMNIFQKIEDNITKGADNMSVNFSESKTKINLMRAFAGESQARNRYTMAGEKAKKMGCYFIYNIFNLTANQEKAHAEIFYNHLKSESGGTVVIDNAGYPVDNYDKIEDLLKSAQHNEYEEYEKVYPEFARIAKEEGFPEIAFSFEKIAEIEKAHGDRFGCFAELIEQSKMFTGNEDTEWLCLNCGHIQKGKSAPKQCPVCKNEQGYFVPYKYYKFVAEKYGLPEM